MAIHETGHTRASVLGTTRGLPVGHDYDHFVESIADVYTGVRPRRANATAFQADFALYDLGRTTLGCIDTPGVSADRDANSLRQISDDAIFVNWSAGPWALEQRRSTWRGNGGAALVLDNSRRYSVIADPKRRLRLASLRIPIGVLPVAVRQSLGTINDRLVGSPHGARLGAQLELLVDAARSAVPGVAAAMVPAILAILNSAAAQTSTQTADLGGSRLEDMRRSARLRLSDASFDLEGLARAFGCSARTVQAEFARGGTSFSTWLRHTRLDRARDALRASDAHRRSIGAIAADHGFADAGTFHRAYRARFGCTPGESRAGRTGDTSDPDIDQS